MSENANEEPKEETAAETAAESSESQEEEKPPSTDVGEIVPGKITNVTNFGAFVKLVGLNQEGLVHISEIANEYVTDIKNHVAEGDDVQVKIIGINKQGKLELSIKRVNEPEQAAPTPFIKTKTKDDDFENRMNSYLKRSEEKQIDIRRNLKKKQGITKKKR